MFDVQPGDLYQLDVPHRLLAGDAPVRPPWPLARCGVVARRLHGTSIDVSRTYWKIAVSHERRQACRNAARQPVFRWPVRHRVDDDEPLGQALSGPIDITLRRYIIKLECVASSSGLATGMLCATAPNKWWRGAEVVIWLHMSRRNHLPTACLPIRCPHIITGLLMNLALLCELVKSRLSLMASRNQFTVWHSPSQIPSWR